MIRRSRPGGHPWLKLLLACALGATPALSQDVAPTASSLKHAARTSFARGDLAQGRDQLQQLLAFYRLRFADRGELAASAWSQCLGEVAREYLRGGLLVEATEVLAEAADLQLPPGAGFDEGLANAVAGWHRRLAALDAEKRFRLLYDWTMPTTQRPTVRILTAVTPLNAPPSVFARALGERPRRDSFPVPRIGEVRGLFSTAWELAQAADEAGRLRRLAAELSDLAEQDVPQARFVHQLIRIVEEQRSSTDLGDELRKHVSNFHSRAAPLSPETDLVLAAACLTRAGLQDTGEELLNELVEQSEGHKLVALEPWVRQAQATAIRQRHPQASPDLLATSGPELWISVDDQAAGLDAGHATGTWITHESHLFHLAGTGVNQLLLRYPLTGEFEFSCEAQIGGDRPVCGVTYGGLGYELSSARQWLTVVQGERTAIEELHCPFLANTSLPRFNKLALRSSGHEWGLYVNQHLIRTDEQEVSTSPWIGLRCSTGSASVFRNLAITGNPVIPREVDLSSDAALRGWISVPSAASPPPAELPAGLPFPARLSARGQGALAGRVARRDWAASDGVLRGTRHSIPAGAAAGSRLVYQRPLLGGETISYEFQYEPEQKIVHPTLGRIAFIIEPEGVQLRWMTAGDQEWTGLADDNTVIEPLNRRGPRPLPLAAGKWNRVSLSLRGDTVSLSLNDAPVYQREMEPESDRTFGFYHDARRTEALIREVKLRGDWPEKLTAQQLGNLTAAADRDRPASDRRALGSILDERHIHDAVLEVRRRASGLSIDERYRFLLGWVLPSEDHDTCRMALDFTPTHPAPPVAAIDPLAGERAVLARQRGEQRVQTGGTLVAPALDLVAVARHLGRLDELSQRLDEFRPADQQQQRSQLSMRVLVALAGGDSAQANQWLEQLAQLVDAGEQTAFVQRWPETLAIAEAARFAETREIAREMVWWILEKQIRQYQPSGHEAWEQFIRAQASRLNYLGVQTAQGLSTDATEIDSALPLRNWIPASREAIRTRGQGFPQGRWERPSPATVKNIASHEDDYLFYRIPLQGNFEVECDISGFGWQDTSLWVAGEFVAPVYTLRQYDRGTFREMQRLDLDPPIHQPEEWIRYRAVVRDGVCTTFFNGLKIRERILEAGHDPWIAIRSPYQTNGGVRNLRITGQPRIPVEVKMTATTELEGWLPINQGHRVGPRRKWQQLGDLQQGGGVFGVRWDDLPGSDRETLLRYHRPLAEDGTIEYEFYYQENASHVHPALDRLAFMLQPDGVRVHWITDGRFDRTGLPPDNLFDEPDHRRGPELLPLRPGAWNRLRLTLVGDVAEMRLNDELVFLRELEPTNQRTFGLFHYADQTEARVRNIVWRGDWPRELPPVDQQELAGEGADFLDESAERLTAVFHHDFGQQGFPRERFGLLSGDREHFQSTADGLKVIRPGAPGYNDSIVAPHLSVTGDFDVIAEFEQFVAEPDIGGSGGIYLAAALENDRGSECRVSRRLLLSRSRPQPIVRATYATKEVGEVRRNFFVAETSEAAAGRLRLSRRGSTVFFSFAEGDSPVFRIVGTQAATADPVLTGGVRLITQAHQGGMTNVVWKNLTIRAQEISGLAELDVAQFLASLEEHRKKLAQDFQHDFARDPFTADRFHRWGAAAEAEPTRHGLPVRSPGTDRWTSVGIAPRVEVTGDFDVGVWFDRLRLAPPKEGENSALYLQIEFPDEAHTQINVLFVERTEGRREVVSQIRVIAEDGSRLYRQLRSVSVEDIQGMRIARQGKTVTFLYRAKGASEDAILARTDSSQLQIPACNIRLMLHTGGAGRQSEVVMKRLHVLGEKVETPSLRPPAPAAAPPGLLRSLLKLLPFAD